MFNDFMDVLLAKHQRFPIIFQKNFFFSKLSSTNLLPGIPTFKHYFTGGSTGLIQSEP